MLSIHFSLSRGRRCVWMILARRFKWCTIKLMSIWLDFQSVLFIPILHHYGLDGAGIFRLFQRSYHLDMHRRLDKRLRNTKSCSIIIFFFSNSNSNSNSPCCAPIANDVAAEEGSSDWNGNRHPRRSWWNTFEAFIDVKYLANRLQTNVCRVSTADDATGARRRDLHPAFQDPGDSVRCRFNPRIMLRRRIHADGRELPHYQSKLSSISHQNQLTNVTFHLGWRLGSLTTTQFLSVNVFLMINETPALILSACKTLIFFFITVVIFVLITFFSYTIPST